MLNLRSDTLKHVQMRSSLASTFLARVSKEIHPGVKPLLGVSYLTTASPWDPSQAAQEALRGQDSPPGAAEPGGEQCCHQLWPSLHPQAGCGGESLPQEKIQIYYYYSWN